MNAEHFLLRTEVPDEDFILNNPFWFMSLSNGETVYDVGDLPEEAIPVYPGSHHTTHHAAWVRLQDYMTAESLRPVSFGIRFRSNQIVVPIHDYPALYISKAVGKDWNDKNADDFLVVGWLDTPTMVKTQWFKLPELILKREAAKEVSSIPADKRFLYYFPALEQAA